MIFLRPAFLWFLFLAAIPLIIHLLNLRPFRTVLFSSLRFLRDIELRTRWERKIVEYILLLLRILAIVALVIAFAQPIEKKELMYRPCQDNVVIYVDNSFSMEARGKGGINLELAKKKAYEILHAYGQETRFIILTNDFLPSQMQSYSWRKVVEIVTRIDVTAQRRSLEQVVAKLKNVIPPSQKCRHYVYLISDFQKTQAHLEKVVFPSQWQVSFLPISPAQKDNVAVDSVFFARPYHSLGAKDSLIVVLRNYGDQAQKDLRVELWINDSLKGFQNVSVPARSVEHASFTFDNTSKGWNSSQVRIKDQVLRFDNVLYFSYFVRDRYNILLVSEGVEPYLRDLYEYKIFRSRIVKPNDLTPATFAGYDVVVLHRVKDLTTGLVSYLADFVSAGGSLVILPNLDDFNATNILLRALSLPQYQRRDTARTQLWDIDLGSQLYKGAVVSYERNELLPKILEYLVRQVDYAKERPVLVAKNGVPLLSVASHGRGKVYVFSFSLDRRTSDFVDNPLFVVTFVNIGLQINSREKCYYVLGRDRWIQLHGEKTEFFKLRSGTMEFMPMFRFVGSRVMISLQEMGLKAGNYLLTDQRDSLLALVSLNYSRMESDLTCFTASEMKKIINQRKIKNVRVIENVVNDVTPVVSREIHVHTLWKIFVVLAILFLILEVLVKRLSNKN